MRTSSAVSILLAFFTSLAFALKTEHTADVFAWPLSAAKSQSLAKVTFNSTTATLKSYTAPSIQPDDDIVRIGFYHPSGTWSGIATSASNFAEGKDKKLQLHVNSNGELYHVGFKALDIGTSGSGGGSKKDDLSVEIVKVRSGPTVQLNKPVVLNQDGSAPEKEPEKSFFQKYWWVIVGFLVLQVVMSGGKGE